jgi:multiple sugar transport system ATP-binding protein
LSYVLFALQTGVIIKVRIGEEALASVRFQNVTKIYGKDVKGVDDFTLEIQDKEFMVFVGPSGCGKTTALRLLAGLEEITSGQIHIGDSLVNDIPPKDRDIAMVFQNYALYPHMTVYDNIAFGLRLRMLKGFFWQITHLKQAQAIKEEIDRKVRQVASMLSIEHLLHRRPKELSGGQRQRVALGRAIVRQPKVFLMDEPLSNLDAKLRVQTRAELIRLHRTLGVTTIYVTHDQVEAMTMGQRIAVIKDGVIQQCDKPEVVYHQPANKFVAGFIGSPPMNFLDAYLVKEDGVCYVQSSDLKFPIQKDHPATQMVDKKVILGIRPEAVYDANMNIPIPITEENTFEAKVDVLEPLGPEYTAYLFTGSGNLFATIDSGTKIKEGHICKFCVNLEQLHLFDAETEVAIRPEKVTMALSEPALS